jgi:hypothetical protein
MEERVGKKSKKKKNGWWEERETGTFSFINPCRM